MLKEPDYVPGPGNYKVNSLFRKTGAGSSSKHNNNGYATFSL